MCGKKMTVLLIFVVLNCSMARYNGRLHCIVGVLPTCYKRKAATYFYPPGGTGPTDTRRPKKVEIINRFSVWDFRLVSTSRFCFLIFNRLGSPSDTFHLLLDNERRQGYERFLLF